MAVLLPLLISEEKQAEHIQIGLSNEWVYLKSWSNFDTWM